MDYGNLYLRPEVKLEPLVSRWYAWPHLLSPPQQAINLAFRYLPTLRSFLASPGIHVATSKDPEMYGGPFVALPMDKVEDVRSYVNQLETDRSAAIKFAQAFRSFDIALQATANGYSLDDMRQQIPEELRGLVDLVYDLNDHPKIRVLEEMFEIEDLGSFGAQELMLHREKDSDRPFFLSSPRLEEPDRTFVRTPFNSQTARLLCEARDRPANIEQIASASGISADELAKYFTDKAPLQGDRYTGSDVRIRYFGHACILFETQDSAVLIDPSFSWDSSSDGSHFSYSDLPEKIDLLILSHGHQDHLVTEYLMQLAHRVDTVLVPASNRGELSDPSLKRMLKLIGFQKIITIDTLETYNTGSIHVKSLPFTGEHSDLDVHGRHCFSISAMGRKALFFVDSDAIDIDVYQRLSDQLRDADIMFVGMECFGAPLSWLYGPLRTVPPSNKNDGSRRLSGANCYRAWRLTENIKPDKIYVYAMGQEPWMKYLMGLNYKEDSVQLTESSKFVEQCRSIGLTAERLYMKFETII